LKVAMGKQDNKVKPGNSKKKRLLSKKGISELGPCETGNPQAHDKAFSREKTWTR